MFKGFTQWLKITKEEKNPNLCTNGMVPAIYRRNRPRGIGRTDRKELIFVEDRKLQEVGKEYFEVYNKFKKLGLTPQRVLEIITALGDVGLINEK